MFDLLLSDVKPTQQLVSGRDAVGRYQPEKDSDVERILTQLL